MCQSYARYQSCVQAAGPEHIGDVTVNCPIPDMATYLIVKLSIIRQVRADLEIISCGHFREEENCDVTFC